MVDVLVNSINSRIEYTFDFIFKERGINYRLLNSENEFNCSKNKKLNYSSVVNDALSIDCSSILYETNIENHKLTFGVFEGDECMTFDGVSDPIASVFYTLVRYEEYLLKDLDEHGRFKFQNSYLCKQNWVQKAVCDRWAESILRKIGVNSIGIKSVMLVPSFDIDNTYAYKLKEGKRKLLSISRDVVRGDSKRLKERKQVESGQKDPYDTFDKISEIARNYDSTLIFWLVGGESKKDRNITINKEEHKALIRKMDGISSVNLHPSYSSNGNLQSIEEERKILEEVVSREVTSSRQHFLRFQIPRTFNALIEAGFTDEYSMGFAEVAGFRCGTARPHKWFDLSQNKETVLTIHPFAYMDGTLNEYMKLSIAESKELVKTLHDEVKTYGGDFVFIWHNETIGDYGNWAGWSDLLNYTLGLNE